MENDKINTLIKKIVSARKRSGFSYENMANELSLTSASYRKIETGETKLTVERLFQISEILDTPLNDLLDIDNSIFQKMNNESTNDYQQRIENFFQETKEVHEKLLQSKDEQIALLKSLLGK